MKIQCTACEAVEAKVLCCADDAALSLGCDEKVHAANSLARKHRRVPLSSSSSRMPKCDICQWDLKQRNLGGSSSKGSLNKAEKLSSFRALPGRGDVVPSTGQFNEAASGHSNAGGSRPSRIPEWHLEEYYGSTSNLYESSEKRPKVCDVTSQDS
ncbi:light-regulated zinc finger protein 1 [Actinidia rufa]|uniref:Light-regulated zinc finger protein 1 n=1 Tax=Actinidia rufa TaxID=165716 RepID=A0A7J0DYK3_9ERIC|nr:light-regulated zinc finger protein 1 [Actinidia rufa]